LLAFYFDVFLARPNNGSIRVGPRQAVIQVCAIGLILQFASNLK
jgi:hypothetical protein